MDQLQLEPNTTIDQGDIGFTFSSHKPSVVNGAESQLPPIGFLNPLLPMEKYPTRFERIDTATFTAATLNKEITIDSTFINNLPQFAALRPLFNNYIVPLSLEFLIVPHAALNVNGVLSAYFDPGVNYDDFVKSEMTSTTTTNESIVKAMNLKAVITSCSDAKEMKLIVPLNFPNNFPIAFTFGKVVIQALTTLYFGTGVNSVNIEIFVRPREFVTQPLYN